MTTPQPPANPPHAVEVGKRVYIRHPLPRDCEAFVASRKASQAHLSPWEPRPPAGFDAFGHDQFEWMYNSRRKPDQERMFIFELSGDQFVGQISLGAITRGPLQSAYMGYWTVASAIGRGVMTEAISLMLRHAFGRVGLHRVEANIQPHNEPSRMVAKKNGFRLEGFSPRYLQIDGVWADHERWALTVEDWHEHSAAAGGSTGSSRNRRARSRPST
jgi:ribosomal-protein-alanine N-acetyltransferase